MSAVVARCSGCGVYSTDRRILTCCKGYCQDKTGKTCNAVQCPGCGRFHYWCGSFEPPAADATIFDAALSEPRIESAAGSAPGEGGAALATAILFAVTAMALLGCATGDPIIDTMGEGLCTAGVVAIGVVSANPFALAGLGLCPPL